MTLVDHLWSHNLLLVIRNVYKRKLITYWLQGSMHDSLFFKMNKICPLSQHWSQRYCDGVGSCPWGLCAVLSSKMYVIPKDTTVLLNIWFRYTDLIALYLLTQGDMPRRNYLS